MTHAEFRLEAALAPLDAPVHGRMTLTLINLSDRALNRFRLALSMMTRVADEHRCDGATLLRRIANFHEFEPDSGAEIPAGGAWSFTVEGLTHRSQHRLDGPKSAYLVLSDGAYLPVDVGDLAIDPAHDSGELKSVPAGRVAMPLSVMPWPQDCAIAGWHDRAPDLRPADTASGADRRSFAKVAALAHRLFPAARKPFRLDRDPGSLPVDCREDPTLPADGYRLDFAPERIGLHHGGVPGRDYGLITLAQILYGARTDPETFSLPKSGSISDAPRYGWRGSHLDVSRHFYPLDSVLRFLDILGWHKMNVLQWHLTDDEGWRLEIEALPELVEIGSKRGADCLMVPQLGSAAETYAGHYSRDDVRRAVARAASLNIDIVPEIDMPGHCTAVLHALPHLRDPGEPEDSYRSVQGYPNNALNPAMPETYAFVETVLGEVAALFPSDYIHIGADEVDDRSWLASPLARALMDEEGLAGTAELQAHFCRKAQAIITGLGKKLAGWDEVADGGGVDTEDTLLVAWRKPEVTARLAGEGYDVVCSPGQKYYMDMAQASGWQEPGASWAGVSTVQHCYEFEADSGLTGDTTARLKGVQSGIWSEHLLTRALFNHMVFPRLGAVAEAGWTRRENKDWQRFAALSRLMPQL